MCRLNVYHKYMKNSSHADRPDNRYRFWPLRRHHTRPLEPGAVARIRDAQRTGLLPGPAGDRLLTEYEEGEKRRGMQLEALAGRLRHLAPDGRVIQISQ